MKCHRHFLNSVFMDVCPGLLFWMGNTYSLLFQYSKATVEEWACREPDPELNQCVEIDFLKGNLNRTQGALELHQRIASVQTLNASDLNTSCLKVSS